MLDNTAKQLSDQMTTSPASNQNISHILSPADSHQIDNRHLTIAKYLPINTFKSAAILKLALDNILNEMNTQRRMGSAPHLRKQAINSTLVCLAKNIAITTAELNVDYGSKLELINTASTHRIFKSGSIIKFCANLISKLINSKNKFRTDAQKILDDAKTKIQTSRDKIILC